MVFKMQQQVINHCINKEVTIWGLKLLGLVFGAVFGILVMIRFDFTFGIVGAAVGYVAGSFISSSMQKGCLQRWIYWNLPLSWILGGNILPPSWQRLFR